jgi:hypothetical protein
MDKLAGVSRSEGANTVSSIRFDLYNSVQYIILGVSTYWFIGASKGSVEVVTE